MARLAILCPGQGGQHSQMFDLVDAQRRAAWADEWALERQLGVPLDALLTDSKAIFENRVAQPLIVAATTMMWLELKDLLPAPALVAGYSIGELSSYVVADAFSPKDAIGLACRRAEMMDACAIKSRTQALLSVSGLATNSVQPLLRDHDAYVAIETADDSLIAGGYRDALIALQESLQNAGAHCTLLPVAVASHTPLMACAVEPFGHALHELSLRDPVIPVVAGITAQAVHAHAEMLDTLPRQISETIRWRDCMDTLAEAGVDVVLELGPGAALSRMMRARYPDIACRSVAEFRSTSGIASWVHRHG